MILFIENETGRKFPFDEEILIKQVVEETLKKEGCPYEAELNVVLTSNEEIREVNKEFRGIDRATDVLSFPALDFDTPGDFSFVEEAGNLYLNPENDALLLGDIMLSVDKVYEQAQEYGHRLEREFAFLIAHSMLHLLGYDHIEKEEGEVMELKQEEILHSLGIGR